MTSRSAERFALAVIRKYEPDRYHQAGDADIELAPVGDQVFIENKAVREEHTWLTKVRNFFSRTVQKLRSNKRQQQEPQQLPPGQAIKMPFTNMLHRVHEHAGLAGHDNSGKNARDKRDLELWMADRWKRKEAGLDKKIGEREAAFLRSLYWNHPPGIKRDTDEQEQLSENLEHYLFGSGVGRQYGLRNRMYEEFASRQQEEVIDHVIRYQNSDTQEIRQIKERLYQQEKQVEQLYTRQRDLIRERHEQVTVRRIREEVEQELDRKLWLAYMKKGM